MLCYFFDRSFSLTPRRGAFPRPYNEDLMTCVIHFQITSVQRYYVLCDSDETPLAFRDCDQGWEWLAQHYASFDFLFPENREEIHCGCINITHRASLIEEVERTIGTHWNACPLKPDVQLTPSVAAPPG